MPVGGPTPYKDVNPVPIHLDQVTVDGAIAEIVEQEDILDSTQLSTANNSEISGVQVDDSKAQDKNTKENIGRRMYLAYNLRYLADKLLYRCMEKVQATQRWH